MDGLDGNAIAGLLCDVFGEDLTIANCTCAGCGAQAPFAETSVFLRGPGTIVRCRTCTDVLAVLVTVRRTTCVDLRGVALLEPV